jgi:hypothetical protein
MYNNNNNNNNNIFLLPACKFKNTSGISICLAVFHFISNAFPVKLSHAEPKGLIHGMDVLQYDVNIKQSH